MPGTAGAWPDVPTLSPALFIPGVLGALTLHVSSQSTSLSPMARPAARSQARYAVPTPAKPRSGGAKPPQATRTAHLPSHTSARPPLLTRVFLMSRQLSGVMFQSQSLPKRVEGPRSTSRNWKQSIVSLS